MVNNMKQKNKIKMKKRLYGFVKSENLQLIIAFLVFIYPMHLFFTSKEKGSLNDLFDLSMIFSLLLAFIAVKVTNMLSRFLGRHLEDCTKLSINYNSITAKYSKCNNMIEYINSSQSPYNKGRKYTSVKMSSKISNKINNQDGYIFPVTQEVLCNNSEFTITDSQIRYKLPEEIDKHYDEIMSSHKYSDVYNQLLIRLDNYTTSGNKLELITSRTTFYDSLVTNRAMDFKWGTNRTIREFLSFGPFFDTLEESPLSNHLGVNGFVITKDNKVIFVSRSNSVSIGKDTLGNSIGASLKAKYALDDQGEFSMEGLIRGIQSEIYDELSIEKSSYAFSYKDNFITLYRDMVEGGKPQFLFYIELKITSEDVEKAYKQAVKDSKSEKDNIINRLSVDGEKLVFIELNQLKQLYITPDNIVYGKKAYMTMPSSAASLVMFIKHLEDKKIITGSEII